MIIFDLMVKSFADALIDFVNAHFHLESLCNGRFHQQLRDTFAPLVVRYVDLMESCIAQSIHKGFEKENWKPKP